MSTEDLTVAQEIGLEPRPEPEREQVVFMEATVRLSVRVKAASQEAAMKLVLEKLPRVLRLSEEVGFRPQWHGVQAKVARVLAPGEVPPMGW